jgi:alpha-tubulin suppressor-like RCC1 family protein
MNHTCAVRVDGTVWCWGSDFTGQVGGGKKGAAPVLAPVQVKTVGAGFAQVSAGGMYTCARREDGKAECWGYDNWGQLGDGNTDAVVRSPVQVVGLGDIRHIAAGGEHACAIVSDGSVWCWGGNGGGECGVEPAHPLRVVSPTVVPLSAKAASLVAAGGYTCAGLEDGYVWCWGSNVSGTLGTGKVDPGYPYNATNVPATVILVDGVTGLASTAEHICATTSVDQVWCWGDSRHGALGNGVANDSALPDPMPTPVKVVSFCP